MCMMDNLQIDQADGSNTQLCKSGSYPGHDEAEGISSPRSTLIASL